MISAKQTLLFLTGFGNVQNYFCRRTKPFVSVLNIFFSNKTFCTHTQLFCTRTQLFCTGTKPVVKGSVFLGRNQPLNYGTITSMEWIKLVSLDFEVAGSNPGRG